MNLTEFWKHAPSWVDTIIVTEDYDEHGNVLDPEKDGAYPLMCSLTMEAICTLPVHVKEGTYYRYVLLSDVMKEFKWTSKETEEFITNRDAYRTFATDQGIEVKISLQYLYCPAVWVKQADVNEFNSKRNKEVIITPENFRNYIGHAAVGQCCKERGDMLAFFVGYNIEKHQPIIQMKIDGKFERPFCLPSETNLKVYK